MELRSTAPAPAWLTVAGWLAATVASIGVAYFALHPLLATAVPEEVAGLPQAGSLPASSLGVGLPPSASTAPTAPPTVQPSASASAVPGRPVTASATPVPRPSTTVQDGWTVTTEAGGAKTYLRSFRALGGDTVIRIAGGQVSLVTATPRNGYRVEPQQTRPDRLVVYFVGVEKASIVDVMWWQNAPYAEVTETGKNG